MSAALDPIRASIPLSAGKNVAGAIALVILAAIAGGVGFLVVSGALDGHWYDLRDLGIPVAHLRGWLDEQNASQPAQLHELLGDHWISYIVTALIGAIGILSFVGGVLLV